MKNKIKLKKLIIILICILVLFSLLSVFINIYEYKLYNKNYNEKISGIVSLVNEKYPDVSDGEILEILEKEKSDDSFLKKYGIDIDDDSAVLVNEKAYRKFIVINVISVIVLGAVMLSAFLLFNGKKDKEIARITGYIEELNKRNYTLHINDISEDELSILKNEIYKTTVMLKESADNSLKDKKNLKKSLEDISHQLKTPITSILVILDNLIEEPDMDAEQRADFIRDIKRETSSINFLVQSLLKLSKFDANTISFIKEETYLKNIVDKAVKNVSALCDLRNVKLNINGNEKAKITCDLRWQAEALSNIIKNCTEHSKEGGSIDIYYEESNVYSYISVRDYGDGISKEDIPHIFERFYKGQNASKDSVGIGLALAKTIIEEENGNIFVTSDETGTLFEIKYFKI